MQTNQAVLGVLGLEKQRKRSLGPRQGSGLCWTLHGGSGGWWEQWGPSRSFCGSLSPTSSSTSLVPASSAFQNLCPLCLALGTQDISLMGFVSVPSSLMLLPTKKSPKPKVAAAQGHVPKLQQGTLAAPRNSLFPCHEPAEF